MISRVIGENPLFPSVRGTSRMINRRPVAVEKDIDRFEHLAVETPAQTILDHIFDDPDVREEFDTSSLLLSNNNRELQAPDDAVDDDGNSDALGVALEKADQRNQSRSKKRVATELNAVSRPTYPDGQGIRRNLKGEETLAFVFDYKAAHRLTPEDVKLAFADEMFLSNVIRELHSNKEPADKEEKLRIRTNRQIAMALTQVYDYMVTRGLEYGYVTAGKVLVFLHVKPKDLQTLFYHLCVPDTDAILPDDEKADGPDGDINLSKTAVAQLTSFCLLTLQSKARPGPAIDKSLSEETEGAKPQLWPNPYGLEEQHESQSTVTTVETAFSAYEGDEGDEQDGQGAKRKLPVRAGCNSTDAARRRRNEDDEDDNDAAGGGTKGRGPFVGLEAPGGSAPNKRKGGPSSGSFGSGGSQSDMYECIPPSRPYCTQTCLLGLKRGGDLDENCPNVSAHRTDKSGQRHAISAQDLTGLVAEQLRRSPYRYCEVVDPYGLQGKIGRIGALFKLEVPPYGYSFVGKGVQSAHVRHLLHENRVYARLDRLQGFAVPVHLGVVDVAFPRGYYLSGGARVTHMMLLSWGGEPSADVGATAAVPDMEEEEKRSSRDVEREGIIQGDLRSPNMLWNEERRRVMLIDFDAAQFLPAAKHKRLSALSGLGGGSKKRARRDCPQMDFNRKKMAL